MSYIDEFIKWLEQPHKREWRPKEVHLLAVTNKKTGKVCDIAVTHDVPPLKRENGNCNACTQRANTATSACKPTSET